MNGFRQACLRFHSAPLIQSEFESAMLVARLKYPEPRILSRERKQRIQRRAAYLVRLRSAEKQSRSLKRMFSNESI
jgi:hypothetical protein